MTCSVLLSLNWLTVKDSVIGIKKLLAWGSHAGFSQKNECHEKKKTHILTIHKDCFTSPWGYSEEASLFHSSCLPEFPSGGLGLKFIFLLLEVLGRSYPFLFGGGAGSVGKEDAIFKISWRCFSLWACWEDSFLRNGPEGPQPPGGCDLEVHVLPTCRSGVCPLGERISVIALLPSVPLTPQIP